MQKEINLLPQKNVGLLQQERTIIIVRALAIFSVFIVVTSLIGVFLLGRNYSVTDVETQQAAIRSKIQPFNSVITKDLILVDRMNHIQTILKTRSLLTDKITSLQNLIPSAVHLETLSISNTAVTLSVSSPSLSSLKTYIDSLTRLVQKKKLFQKLTINAVTVDGTTGIYSVSIQGILL